MGAANSTQATSDKKSLTKVIDFVATNYILTQNFNDMKNLAKLDYCNNLVVMTADIIAKKLNESDIRYLAQRIKDGVEINEMVNEKVIYLKKADLPELDIKNETQKRRVCIGIAKHYVLIAHLFAAIVTTINPIYTYKDKYGSTVRATLMNKQTIPKGAETSIKKFNICTQRLNALMNNQDFNVKKDTITVKPKFCDMNYDRVRGRDRSLFEEPGIPELEKLYYDKYDDDNGGFKGMTTKMRKEVYEKDVERFYKAFTGNDAIPIGEDGEPAVKKFSQIPLRDFHRSKGCATDGVYTKAYTGSAKDKLFGDYAQHIKTMMQTAETNQDKLIKIIDQIFVVSNNPSTGRKDVVINPGITEAYLVNLVTQTRTIIIDLYITCEDDFIKGLELFEAIVEKQIVDTSKEQIAVLEKTIQDSITEDLDNQPSKVTADEEGDVQDSVLQQKQAEEMVENIEKKAEQDSGNEPASGNEPPSGNEPASGSDKPEAVKSDIPKSNISPEKDLVNDVATMRAELEDLKMQKKAEEMAKNIIKQNEDAAIKKSKYFRPVGYVDDTGNILDLDESNRPIQEDVALPQPAAGGN